MTEPLQDPPPKPWDEGSPALEVRRLAAYVAANDWVDPRLVGVAELFDRPSNDLDLEALFVDVGAEWLVPVIRPLATILSEMRTDTNAIASLASSWESLALEYWEMSADLYAASQFETLTWIGDAADAYRELHRKLIGPVDAIGWLCETMRTAADRTRELHGAALNMVLDLASGLASAMLERLPDWQMQLTVSNGSFLSSLVAEAAAITFAWVRVAFAYVEALVDSISTLTAFLNG